MRGDIHPTNLFFSTTRNRRRSSPTHALAFLVQGNLRLTMESLRADHSATPGPGHHACTTTVAIGRQSFLPILGTSASLAGSDDCTRPAGRKPRTGSFE